MTYLHPRSTTMSRFVLLAAALSLAAPVPAALAQAPTGIGIARAGSQPSARGSAEYFIGAVRIDPLFPAATPSRMSGGSVTFEPGARSAWHTHPAGQVLVVTAGLGWIQQEGSPVQEMRPGDVIRIPPGLRHWHGATATTGVTHLALQEEVDGAAVTWMAQVSDAQYRR
jgi:quercetin dioxygenase-like cupin family protein